MSLPRRKRAKGEKAEEAAAARKGDAPAGEMKRMEPRRGEGPYSMARLERAVSRLVDGQAALLERIDALEKAIAERDGRITDLDAELRSSEEKRARAVEGIDRILDQLDELEGRAESAAFPRVE